MWTSTNFTTYKKQFDFTSSEQGKPTFTALKIDDKDFINMIEGLEGEIASLPNRLLAQAFNEI